MEKLNFDQMESVAGGVSACTAVMFTVGVGIGALGVAVTISTGGAAAWVMFGYSAWISGVGTFLCYY